MTATRAAAGLVVTIPGTPDKALWPNNYSRYPRAKAVKAARHEAFMWTRQILGGSPPVMMDGPVLMSITIAWPKGARRPDGDNMIASAKPLIDGIADALARDYPGFNDRQFRITGCTQILADPDDRAGWMSFALTPEE